MSLVVLKNIHIFPPIRPINPIKKIALYNSSTSSLIRHQQHQQHRPPIYRPFKTHNLDEKSYVSTRSFSAVAPRGLIPAFPIDDDNDTKIEGTKIEGTKIEGTKIEGTKIDTKNDVLFFQNDHFKSLYFTNFHAVEWGFSTDQHYLSKFIETVVNRNQIALSNKELENLKRFEELYTRSKDDIRFYDKVNIGIASIGASINLYLYKIPFHPDLWIGSSTVAILTLMLIFLPQRHRTNNKDAIKNIIHDSFINLCYDIRGQLITKSH